MQSVGEAETIVYRAAGVADASGRSSRSGAVAVTDGRITACGHSEEVTRLVEAARVVELSRVLLLPGLVNAHAHLNLTNLGPQRFGGKFVDWLRWVIEYGPRDAVEAANAARRGAVMSVRSGVAYIGDIVAGDGEIKARQQHGLGGVSFLELFGIGRGAAEAARRLPAKFEEATASASGDSAVGLQPHAPYSADKELYEAAAQLAVTSNLRLSTHLAETMEEIEFVRDGCGPFVDLLRSLDKWDNSIRGSGMHPVEWLVELQPQRPWLLAHCNYIEAAHMELLRTVGASVAYCPRASDYFGHHRPGRGVRHRYREMLESGLDVCLGTDSIVCQPADEAQPLGILPQMRYLHRRDGVEPATLLAMATVNGLKALGLPIAWGLLEPGAPARLIGVEVDPDDETDLLLQVMRNDHPVQPIGWGDERLMS